jgi:hypothetical protein
MSQSNLFVPITLDKERRLRLTIHDVDDALDSLQRPGGPEVTTFDLLGQLAALKWRAYSAILRVGLREDDPTIRTMEKARTILDEYLQHGGNLALVAWAIKRAMLLSGAMSWDLWQQLATAEEKSLYGDADPRTVTESIR